MVYINDGGSGNQHAPIAVKGQNRERTKDMKMRFNAPTGEMDEQSRHQHLPNGNGMACQRLAGLSQGEENGQYRNQASQKQGGEDVNMDVAVRALPGRGRNQESGGNR